jgi:hypothetical protein
MSHLDLDVQTFAVGIEDQSGKISMGSRRVQNSIYGAVTKVFYDSRGRARFDLDHTESKR